MCTVFLVIYDFVMYYMYGGFGSSLLIESTDSKENRYIFKRSNLHRVLRIILHPYGPFTYGMAGGQNLHFLLSFSHHLHALLFI